MVLGLAHGKNNGYRRGRIDTEVFKWRKCRAERSSKRWRWRWRYWKLGIVGVVDEKLHVRKWYLTGDGQKKPLDETADTHNAARIVSGRRNEKQEWGEERRVKEKEINRWMAFTLSLLSFAWPLVLFLLPHFFPYSFSLLTWIERVVEKEIANNVRTVWQQHSLHFLQVLSPDARPGTEIFIQLELERPHERWRGE